ncbi:MAG: Ni/Fe-hydrogenase, b-type cytochrome subunit [Rubrivivax sp.]|nr:Ni/Fe-hydrogenase, b-type cytochrome subunit [Rubrivivax sp.]
MSTHSSTYFPVYVWQVPVRIWHWVMAASMLVLCVSGYLIGSPLPSQGGEASNSYLFGYVRFAHFAAAYLFAVMFVLRVIWAFVGNRFAREIFTLPLALFSPKFWNGFIDQTKYYLFLKPDARPWQGHNPVAMAAMFFMYVLGSVFMIVTGFALYGEGLGMGSWAYTLFSSWVLPLFGYSMNVHTLHHLGMWYLIVFTIAHLYMAIREDICSNETVVSTMVNGWRVAKK